VYTSIKAGEQFLRLNEHFVVSMQSYSLVGMGREAEAQLDAKSMFGLTRANGNNCLKVE
jgi:hypothetical protein